MGIKDEILNVIARRQPASFIDLEENIPGFKGIFELSIRIKDKDMFLWSQISSDAIRAIHELVEDNKIIVKGCSRLVYAMDGAFYPNENWIPAVMSINNTSSEGDNNDK